MNQILRKGNFPRLLARDFLALLACSFMLAQPGYAKGHPAYSKEAQQIRLNQADVTLKGTVTDSKGETIPGATIKVKNTNKSTVSNAQGEFTLLLAPGEDVLLVSFVGFKTQEVSVKNKKTVRITLENGMSTLDEVVVIGYGTVKKKDLTGAVSSVNGNDIAMNPVSNPLEALEGRVSGLDVQRTSGSAGSSPTVLLRGNRSITGSSTPLYIIDGIQGNANVLNPDDIERIDVLKDASSTAIYGSKGANGVIIITTKKGKAGKTQIDVDSYYGVNGFATFPKPLQGDAWLQYLKDKYFASNGTQATDIVTQLGLSTYVKDAINSNQYVDWVDVTLQRGSQQNHHIAIRGGTDKIQAYLSAGLVNEQGIYKGDEVRTYNTRAGADIQFNKIFKAGIQSLLSWRDGNGTNSRINKAYGMYPVGQPYNADGSVNLYPITGDLTVSPIANYEPGVFINNTKNLYTALTPYVEISPVKNLTIRSNLGITLGLSRNGTFDNEKSYNNAAISLNTKEASYTTGFNYNYLWENIVNYNFNLNKDHSLALTGIASVEDNNTESSTISGQGLDYNEFLYYNLGAAATSTNRSTGYVGKALVSFAGRLNYSYKGKYLLTVSNRIDGASQLVRKWSQFPSAAIGWRVSEENFMRGTKSWLSNMKLRAAYGVSGNSDILPYNSLTQVQSNSISTPLTLGGTSTLPIYILTKTISNPDLTWERTTNANIGLDMSFFNDRVDFAAEAYYTHTDGLLYARNLPSSSGGFDAKNAYTKTDNIGKSVNHGLELTVNGRAIKSKNFNWNTTLTYTRSDETLTALDLGNSITPTQLVSLNLFIGSPIYNIYGYKKAGIWQTDEAAEAVKYGAKPGDIKLQTVPTITAGVSDNGVHAYSPNDRMVVGHTNPDWSLGWQNTFTYKGLDLTLFVTARYGQTIAAQILGYYNAIAQPSSYNYWTPSNPTNDFPQPYQGSTINTTYSSALTYVDGSYMKIKNVTLGYTLPSRISNKAGISKVRIYGTAYNPFIYAKSAMLKNVDPETGGTDSFPLYKQIVFGINLSL
jgi:TonB-linked SusC/RagA family outer membrane protein